MRDPVDSSDARGRGLGVGVPRASADLLHAVFQSSPALYAIAEMASGRHVDVNATWLETFGYTREEMVGRTGAELGLWADPADRERYLAELARDGRAHRFRAEFRTRTGEPIHLEAYATRLEIEGVERVLIMALDRSAERRAEERLVDAIESLTEGFVLHDADDRMVLCNQRYRELYDVPEDAEVLEPGRRFEEFVRFNVGRGLFPESAGREEAFVHERLADRLRADVPPVERQFFDGRWLMVSDRRTARGELVGIRTDITRLKEVQEDLTRLNEQLERRVEERTEELKRAERLAALGKLTGTVAHEIRNPLGTVRVCTHILRERLNSEGVDMETVLGRLDRAVRRCDNIINELLDFARSTPLNAAPRMPASTPDWVDFTVGEQNPAAGRVSRLQTERSRLGDADARLSITESSCAGSSSTSSTMRCEAMVRVRPRAARWTAAPVRERHQSAPRGQMVAIVCVFADNGTRESRRGGPWQRLFEPLFSTKSFGVGLGLPTVKQIMEQHGGTVQVANLDGGGARVRLTLPG